MRGGSRVARRIASRAVDASHQSALPLRRASQNQCPPAATPPAPHLLAAHLDMTARRSDGHDLGTIADCAPARHAGGKPSLPSSSAHRTSGRAGSSPTALTHPAFRAGTAVGALNDTECGHERTSVGDIRRGHLPGNTLAAISAQPGLLPTRAAHPVASSRACADPESGCARAAMDRDDRLGGRTRA
jgi:hypothetical protein